MQGRTQTNPETVSQVHLRVHQRLAGESVWIWNYLSRCQKFAIVVGSHSQPHMLPRPYLCCCTLTLLLATWPSPFLSLHHQEP